MRVLCWELGVLGLQGQVGPGGPEGGDGKLGSMPADGIASHSGSGWSQAGGRASPAG